MLLFQAVIKSAKTLQNVYSLSTLYIVLVRINFQILSQPCQLLSTRWIDCFITKLSSQYLGKLAFGHYSIVVSFSFQIVSFLFLTQETADQAIGATGSDGQNIREGIAHVMEAMRDLLTNIRPVPPPLENADRQDEEQHDINNDNGDGGGDYDQH